LQKIVVVNWKVLESQISSSLGWIANETITNESSNSSVSQVIDTLGIPFAAPLALAPVAGFMKGKKNIL
jgi:hypothetical protein